MPANEMREHNMQARPSLPPAPADLDSIDFLLAQICRLHHGRAHTLLEGIGLYRGQPPLLTILHQEEGLTHGDLAARMAVTPATMTKMIQRMERAGFVQRQPDADDQRVSRVYLTGTGRAVRSEMLTVLGVLEAETFAGFSPDELERIRSFFLQIRDNLRQVGAEKALPEETAH
jgi:MarR family transcriptional regulator, organic hydroperoxide resistance regulator